MGLGQYELSARHGPGLVTLQTVEAGTDKKLWPKTVVSLEDSLEWERGSVQRVLDGGDPTVKRAADEPPIVIPIPAAIPEQDRAAAREAAVRVAAEVLAAYARETRGD